MTLRPWQPDDAASLFAAVQSTPDLDTQLDRSAVCDMDAAMIFIRSAFAWDPDSGMCSFAIDVDGRAAGNVGLSHIDRRHRTAWLSYWIAGDNRGHGLAGRAAAGVADWALQELDLFRIELGHRVNNPASCAVARRAGFLPEGIERSKLEHGGVRFDVETHARLATDPAPALDLPAVSL
ncbi:GNAT family N-acetyltransferase [Arthrobacter sp. 7Tela_A1]|uniref:GNAT family N-acetyltransferase n=1 Tax=Arthrobacter sp. 7Tela_A1 TaxID=3093745 RepID=UPI003BB6442A